MTRSKCTKSCPTFVFYTSFVKPHKGPEEVFWKAGCTRQRLNDDFYFKLDLAKGETVKIYVVSVEFIFMHPKNDSGGEEVIDKGQLYIVGTGSCETVGAIPWSNSRMMFKLNSKH